VEKQKKPEINSSESRAVYLKINSQFYFPSRVFQLQGEGGAQISCYADDVITNRAVFPSAGWTAAGAAGSLTDQGLGRRWGLRSGQQGLLGAAGVVERCLSRQQRSSTSSASDTGWPLPPPSHTHPLHTHTHTPGQPCLCLACPHASVMHGSVGSDSRLLLPQTSLQPPSAGDADTVWGNCWS